MGHHVIDLGCGPGYASFELAQLVGPGGRVVGVDESASFINYLNTQVIARSLKQLHGVVGDVQDLPGMRATGAGEYLRPGSFDLAYQRWVLCFVPKPDAMIAGAAELLKPGGRFVIHDYFNYASMTMAPRRASHDKAVAATVASWRERGGDPDIAGRLPRMLKAHGFTVTHLEVHQRLARPADTMFHWPDVWWRTYAPKLVQMGFLAQADCDQLLRDLDEVGQSTTDFVVPPPVFELVAVKG